MDGSDSSFCLPHSGLWRFATSFFTPSGAVDASSRLWKVTGIAVEGKEKDVMVQDELVPRRLGRVLIK